MAAQPNLRPGKPVEASSSGTAWQRGRGGFEWVAPAPSPAVVAELERLFPDVIQVPSIPLEAEEDRWGSHAIFARCLSRWIPPEVLVRELLRAGLPGDIEALALANKHYILHFSDVRAKSLALERPWVVYGQPIITADWIPEFVPAGSSINHALLWIRLPQLPIEFWNDEILSSILAVAGQFLFSDESTKARKRGSFARACVRVDLSRPLRPGARIRGGRAPFWQQFLYENLEGICDLCGSVHLSGSCQADSESSPSPPGSCYGPWMAAVRRRKAIPALSSGERSGAPRPSSALADGWEVPKRLARRHLSRDSGLLPPSLELMNQPAMSSGEQSVKLKSHTVENVKTVPVGTVAEFQKNLTHKADGVCVSNPFNCLEPECGAVQSKARVVGSSGSSKRSRPTELISQRVASRSSKAKGKGPLGGKASVPGSFTFHASADPARGLPNPSVPEKKKSRCKEGLRLRSDPGHPLPAQLEVVSHDSAVLLLKKAILRGEEAAAMDLSHSEDSTLQDEEVAAMDSSHSVDLGLRGEEAIAMESSLPEDCRDKGPAVDFLPAVDHGLEVSLGDRIGVPPTQATE